jgi:putative ABC transport system permease protein
MIFLKVAWQNMMKHRRRTALIIFSTGLSVAVILFVAGMVEGFKVNFFRNMLQQSGHLQLLPQGQEEALNPYDLELLLDNPDELVEAVQQRDGIKTAEKILTFGAMLLAEEKNLTIAGAGTHPDSLFFEKAREGIYAGDFLAEENGLAISRNIAGLLHVEPGDPVVVLVEDSSGSPWYMEYPVTGLFETDSRDFDEMYFFINHSQAEDLLYVPGQTREIRVLLDDKEEAPSLADNLTGRPPFQDACEIKEWHEIHGSYLVLLRMFDVFIVFINIFTIIVAATVITNSILMNIFERAREHGTLRAIGMKRSQIFGLIMTEGFLQGLAGSLLGLMIGIPLVLYFQAYGMNWGAITESFGVGRTFNFAFSPQYAFSSLAAGVLIACGGSLYAGLISVRMSIMDSLRAV